MANGACFKHIAKIYASPARKVAVLPQMAIFFQFLRHCVTPYNPHGVTLPRYVRPFAASVVDIII